MVIPHRYGLQLNFLVILIFLCLIYNVDSGGSRGGSLGADEPPLALVKELIGSY